MIPPRRTLILGYLDMKNESLFFQADYYRPDLGRQRAHSPWLRVRAVRQQVATISGNWSCGEYAELGFVGN
jgi:hypothetical protein